MSRRGFLGVAAAALGGVMLAPGIRLIEVAQAATPSTGANPAVRWGLLIDVNQCAEGCNACVQACNAENGLDPTPTRTSAQWIRIVQVKETKTTRAAQLPVMCQHCAEPPCVDVCPTGASFKRADGIVLVDRHICIGCRYCMMACPYKARSIVFEEVTGQNPDVPRGKGCVEACTLCVHRVDHDRQPACVEACAKAGHNAMIFGDLNDPDSEIAKRVREIGGTALRADLKLRTAVRYQGI